MKRIILILLLAAMCLSAHSEGGVAMPVDALLARAGIEADAALREKAEAFVAQRHLTERIIRMMDPALARRYLEYLAADMPISYTALLDEPTALLPKDADYGTLQQLAVLQPEGAATCALLVDFERGRLYFDEAWPVPEDVCRAACATELKEDDAQTLLDILTDAKLEDWSTEYAGDASAGVCVLALRFDDAIVRFTVPALSTAPQIVPDTLAALLNIGAKAANET